MKKKKKKKTKDKIHNKEPELCVFFENIELKKYEHWSLFLLVVGKIDFVNENSWAT